ncbi:MAG: endonuclease domain-containing protein [Bacteroidales bacterium]|nr:endonuclease domain-containing protein [Bacteroidales bacterium]
MQNDKDSETKNKFYWHDTADPILYPQLLEYARYNRRHPTESESVLWNVLKSRGLGVPFLRQFIIDQYIVDFVYKKGKLVIEVDGGYHSEPRQAIEDENRTRRLQYLGYRVLRFTNEDIVFNIDYVIKSIKYNL